MKIEYNYNSNREYKFGCVIGFRNREDLVKATFESLKRSYVPEDLLFVIIDDGSDSEINISIDHDHILLRKEKSYGIANSLAIGWDILYRLGVKYLLNLDSDVAVSQNWLSALLNTHEMQKRKCLVTGFNGSNHKVTKDFLFFKAKKSIGGINLFFERDMYGLVRQSLTLSPIHTATEDADSYGKNPKIHPVYAGWDWGLMHLCERERIPKICTHNSVIQHTGRHGMTSGPSFFEQSGDFVDACVPKIIHQMWKDNNVPDHLAIMRDSVIENHKDYEYRFWTDEKIDSFVGDFYPGILDFYRHGFEYVIQRFDFARMLIIYHYGGLYLDMDVLCVKSFGSLESPCSFGMTKKHPAFSEKHYPFVLNNALVAAEKFNDFIRSILLRIIRYQDPPKYKEYCSFDVPYTKVLRSAGPLCVTDAYKGYVHKEFVNILPVNYLHGLDFKKPIKILKQIEIAKVLSSQMNECRFFHMHESSWWRMEGKPVHPFKNELYLPGEKNENKRKAEGELLKGGRKMEDQVVVDFLQDKIKNLELDIQYKLHVISEIEKKLEQCEKNSE